MTFPKYSTVYFGFAIGIALCIDVSIAIAHWMSHLYVGLAPTYALQLRHVQLQYTLEVQLHYNNTRAMLDVLSLTM